MISALTKIFKGIYRNIKSNAYDKYHIIPIGKDCDVAHQLRDWGVRKHALPFDWSVTPISAVIALIDNDFDDFMTYENCVFSAPQKTMVFDDAGDSVIESVRLKSLVICRKYHIQYPHDFDSSDIDDFNETKSKYLRRIERFKTLMADTTPVLFVVDPVEIKKYQRDEYSFHINVAVHNPIKDWHARLAEVIQRGYPDKQFDIRTIDELTNEFKLSFSMSGLRFIRRKIKRIKKIKRFM